MGQILLNVFMVFILPVVIGIAVRVAVGKMRKPYIVTSGLILLAVVMWAIVVIVPSHGSEASGIMAMMATCLAVGALVAGLITRICHKTPMQNNEDSESMKKRKVFIVCGALLVSVILCVCVYVGIRSNQIKNEMWDYLKANNYAENEIKSIDVKHSFMNALLSYNEWTVDVVFEDELTSVYKYTVKEGSIVQSGVSGTTDKENLKHLDVDKLIYGDIERTGEPDEYPAILINREGSSTAMEEAVEHDLSNAGELVVSETIEKDEVFIISPDVCTNSEEISVTNNGTVDLTVYLYNFGDVVRQISLAAGDTKVIDGLNGAFPYKVGVSAEVDAQIELTITD